MSQRYSSLIWTMFLACSLWADQGAETVRVLVRSVRADVVVTDRQGSPVAGLEPADFTITEGGRPRQITHCLYVSSTDEGWFDGEAAGTLAGCPGALVPRGKRPVIIVVDDLRMTSSTLATIRRDLHRFVTESLRSGEVMALACTGKSLDRGALESFTDDRMRLQAAVDRLRARPRHRSIVMTSLNEGRSFEDWSLPTTDAVHVGEEDTHVADSLRSLLWLIRGLAPLPGVKDLLFISPGLPLHHAKADTYRLYAMRDYPLVRAYRLRVIDEANAAGVRIHTLDARGRDHGGAYDYERTLEGLTNVAAKTGGECYYNRNHLQHWLREALDHNRGYYLLAFTPAPGDLTPAEEFKGLHRLQITLQHEDGRRLRYRERFPGAVARRSLATDATPATRLLQTAIWPFHAHPLGLEAMVDWQADSAGGFTVQCRISVAEKCLAWDEGKHVWRSRLDFLIQLYDDAGSVVRQRRIAHSWELTTAERRPAGGLLISKSFWVAKEGEYQFRIAACGEGESQRDMALHFFTLKRASGGE
ncbi:MAG: VWA domain-containing protein [Acidobacteria bacterium]|nr:VWA domain-containing protein [Acidobacteriota bacterium]